MTDIALFPIPNCVAFPGTVFPLHVFEPRYRAMVRHCIARDMLMGICHTQKVVHEGKSGQSLEEALNSNQATYKPHEVFSAGPCRLEDELEDGRMLVSVHLQKRYRVESETQTLPFRICACAEYRDQVDPEVSADDLATARERLMKRMIALTASVPELQAMFASETWRKKDPVAFSFEIFGILQLEPDLQQAVLEERSALQRMLGALDLINQDLR